MGIVCFQIAGKPVVYSLLHYGRGLEDWHICSHLSNLPPLLGIVPLPSYGLQLGLPWPPEVASSIA